MVQRFYGKQSQHALVFAVTLVFAVFISESRVAAKEYNPTIKPHLKSSSKRTAHAATAEELQKCINSNQPKHGATSWQNAKYINASRLEVVRAWWSKKATHLPLTIVTQLSWDRKWQLKALCNSYEGPVSAAMYVSSLLVDWQRKSSNGRSEHLSKMRSLISSIFNFYRHLNESGRCSLDILIIHEVVADTSSSKLFPVNHLRNYARLQARTPLIGLLDVDLVVSRTLELEFNDPLKAKYYTSQAQEKNVFVLPAFVIDATPAGISRTTETKLVENLVKENKTNLYPLFKKGLAKRFDPLTEGHAATRYPVWFNSSEPYQVQYRARYEPWVLADRFITPWYDVRFRGYGKNKIVQIACMNISGFHFLIHPSVFVLHRPHDTSVSKFMHYHDRLANTSKDSLYARNLVLATEAAEAMAQGLYEPILDPATLACRKSLSWWQNSGNI